MKHAMAGAQGKGGHKMSTPGEHLLKSHKNALTTMTSLEPFD